MSNIKSVLLEKIQADLRAAQLAREELRTSVLRMLLSAANYRRIELQRELGEAEVIAVLGKGVKQRKESIDAYRESRPDLADKEKAEMDILSGYLPQQVSDDQLEIWVREAIGATGAVGMRDMGRVIGLVREKAGASADGGRISIAVKKVLGV